MIISQSRLRHRLITNHPSQSMPWAREKITLAPKGMRASWDGFYCIFERILLHFWTNWPWSSLEAILMALLALAPGMCGSNGCGYTNSWLGLGHVHVFDEAMKFDMSQSLSKTICNHLIGWNVGEFDPRRSHLVADVMMLYQCAWSLSGRLDCAPKLSILDYHFSIRWRSLPPTLDVEVVFNHMGACVILGDLDESMLLVWL